MRSYKRAVKCLFTMLPQYLGSINDDAKGPVVCTWSAVLVDAVEHSPMLTSIGYSDV